MTPAPGLARTNEGWLADLRDPGPAREAALADLRALLLDGLRRGLMGWVETAGPEFEPLAEDFVQEALLRVLAHLDTFRGRSQFTTWAHKIAVRVALTELRRRRWQDLSLEGVLEAGETSGAAVPPAMAGAAPGPDLAAEQADLLARVQRMMMEDLTERQRQALAAVVLHAVPMGEVARRMGMERNALYKLLHDARLRLKNRLARDGMSVDDLLAVFERG